MSQLPLYTTIVEQTFGELDTLLNTFVYGGYSALANYIKAPLGLAVVVYIALLGYGITHGWIKMTIPNLVKAGIKLGLIYMFAINWQYFSEFVIGTFSDGASHVGAVLIQSSPFHLPVFGGEGIKGALQEALIEFTQIGSQLWGHGSLMNLQPLVLSVSIYSFGYALIFLACLELIMGKLMMALLFVTAPLFICFTLFKTTHKFFDNWLGALSGFAFLYIFVSAMTGFALTLTQMITGALVLGHLLHFSIGEFIPLLFVAFIGLGIVMKSASLAQALGGVISTASGSALLAGTVGGMIGGTLSNLNRVRQLLRGPAGVVGMFRNSMKRVGEKSFSAVKSRIRKGE